KGASQREIPSFWYDVTSTRFLSQRLHGSLFLTEETSKRCDEWLRWKPYQRVGEISFESVFTEERDETKPSGKDGSSSSFNMSRSETHPCRKSEHEHIPAFRRGKEQSMQPPSDGCQFRQ